MERVSARRPGGPRGNALRDRAGHPVWSVECQSLDAPKEHQPLCMAMGTNYPCVHGQKPDRVRIRVLICAHGCGYGFVFVPDG